MTRLIDMETIDQKITLLSQIEEKSPPSELYDKVRERVIYLDKRFLIRLLIVISLGLFMTILTFKLGKTGQNNQPLETYLSTTYNLYENE